MKDIKSNLIKSKGMLVSKKKGFTLVELMVVLAIIATMTFIAVPNFTSVKVSVNQKVDDQSCEAIKRIITTFVADDTIDSSEVKVLTYNANVSRNKVIGINGNNLNTNSKKILNEALSDVKPPRVDNSMIYNINIDDNGNIVTVTTQKAIDTTSSGSGSPKNQG